MAGWLMPFAQNVGTQVATGYALDYLTPKPVQPGQVNRQGPPPLQTQGTGNMVPAQYRGPILHEAAYVDPFAAGYFDNGGLVGWDPDADQGINRGVGDAYDYTAGRENTSPVKEATKEVAAAYEGDNSSNEDMYGRPWGHPDYGKPLGGSAPYDEGTYSNLKQGAALAGGAALLGAPVAAMAGPLALPLAAMHLWKNRDRVKDDFSKFGKSFKENFSKEGRESFYDRQDADVNRQNAGWGDYYTDEHGNTKQKHATWRDFTRAMSGETNWGGQPQGVHALPENQAAALPTDNSNDNSGGYHEEAQGGNYDSGLGDWGSSQDSAQFINRGGKVNCGPLAYKNEGGELKPDSSKHSDAAAARHRELYDAGMHIDPQGWNPLREGSGVNRIIEGVSNFFNTSEEEQAAAEAEAQRKAYVQQALAEKAARDKERAYIAAQYQAIPKSIDDENARRRKEYSDKFNYEPEYIWSWGAPMTSTAWNATNLFNDITDSSIASPQYREYMKGAPADITYKNEGGNIMPPDTVVDGKFFSSHTPKFKERVGPLAKTVHKDKDGASWERHYHDPDKPKGGDNAQTKEGNGAGSVRK